MEFFVASIRQKHIQVKELRPELLKVLLTSGKISLT
jgi:hypothetical protein